MKEDKNLAPLHNYFKELVPPHDLAQLIDNLIFDYARLIILLAQEESISNLDIHPEANNAIYRLREFRDALNKCEE